MELSSEQKKQSVLYCHICGRKAKANATVCANCGTKLGTLTSTSETTGSLSSLSQTDESKTSRIVYYRPRGIQGNYKLGVILGLLPTESVRGLRYYPKGYHPTPLIEPTGTYPVHQSGRLISTTYVYVISQFAPGHKLIFRIQDQDVFYPQHEAYGADMKRIIRTTDEDTKYTLQVLKKQELKKIALYDLDAMGIAPGQETTIVEAETDHIATIRHLLLAPEDKGKQ